VGEYEEHLDRVLTRYYPAARAFRWPPSVVDRESALIVSALLTIEGVVNELRGEQQARANRQATAPSTIRDGSMAG
jgi:hypothetical protein